MSPRQGGGRQRSATAPARVAAYETLLAVEAGTADLPHALARSRDGLPDERDRALAGEIATGSLRWQGASDHLIATFTKRPVSRLDREVLTILRSTIFQLLHLDRVPASAAVNDAVSLTRRAGKTSAAPLVNAVLRRISRERDRLPFPARPAWAPAPSLGGLTPISFRTVAESDRGLTPVEFGSAAKSEWGLTPERRAEAVDYLTTTLSHPRWLAERWLNAYGFEAAEAWMRFNNAAAPLTLRVNSLKISRDDLIAALAAHGVTVTPGRHAQDALIVSQGNPLLTPIARDGLFFVQDEASQLVASLVAARAGDRVLDACASPGGKTVAIAGTMGDRGLVVAADVRGRRLDLLTRTVARSGASSVRILQADASALPFDVSHGVFDWILLDAPCSGLGTVRRDPDIKWRRTSDDLPALQRSQVAMLREAARVLRPGGHLVYSTCSSEPEENEHVVDEVLASGLLGPATGSRFRTFPFRDGLEAFFAAVLVKPRG